MASINIINASSLRDGELSAIAGGVRQEFEIPVGVSKKMLPLQRVYDSSRQQYNSTALLSYLSSMEIDAQKKTIALVDVDLFIPVLTFVFGEAALNGVVAVVSTHRLRNEFYGLKEEDTLLRQRVEKEIIHELGHTFGLFHCRQFECVMRSSTYVEEIDLKKQELCEECKKLYLKGK